MNPLFNKLTGPADRLAAKRPINAILLVCSLIIFLTNPLAYANENTPVKKLTEIGLKEAIDKKMVTVKITGADKPEIYAETVDQEGLHFGKCMAITIKSIK